MLAGFDDGLEEPFLARFEADGAHDADFGRSGLSHGDASVNSRDASLAVQVDGKLVVAGTAYLGGAFPRNYLARFEPDGALDSSFGSGGVTHPGLTAAGPSVGVDIQADGKLVFAGHDGPGFEDYLTRLLPSGTTDLDFGSNGIARPGVPSPWGAGLDAAVQPDGKLLLAGVDSGVGEAFLARFLADGSADFGFGLGGIAHTGVASADESRLSLAIQPDGRLVLAGHDSAVGEDFLARFSREGFLDDSFGFGGIARVGLASSPDSGVGLALQLDGKLVVAGVDSVAGQDFLARLLPDGTPDSGFGTNGHVHSGVPSAPDSRVGVAIQSDGKLVLAGVDTGFRAFLARFTEGGAFDGEFGSGGIVNTGIWSSAAEVKLQGGRPILAGEHGLLFIARLNNALVFADGFESGDHAAWSRSVP